MRKPTQQEIYALGYLSYLPKEERLRLYNLPHGESLQAMIEACKDVKFRLEALEFEKLFDEHSGDTRRMAFALGVSRTTVYRRCKLYNINLRRKKKCNRT